MAGRTRVIEYTDERGRTNPVGLVDEDGTVYTLKGNVSNPRRFLAGSLMINKAHAKRLRGLEQMWERDRRD